jgi:hypothetical protein
MSVTHRLRAIAAAFALSVVVAGASFAASAGAVPDHPLRSSPSSASHSGTQDSTREGPAAASPPTWPTNPQTLSSPAESVPAEDDGPSWTATVLVGGLFLFAAAGLGALAGRARARSRSVRA